MGSIIDRLFPFLVGHRTEAVIIIQALGMALQAFGLVTAEQMSRVTEIVAPLGLATLLAKVTRPPGT